MRIAFALATLLLLAGCTASMRVDDGKAGIGPGNSANAHANAPGQQKKK